MRRCGHVAGNCVYKIARIVTRVDLDTKDRRHLRGSLFGLTDGSVADAATRLTGLRTAARAAA